MFTCDEFYDGKCVQIGGISSSDLAGEARINNAKQRKTGFHHKRQMHKCLTLLLYSFFYYSPGGSHCTHTQGETMHTIPCLLWAHLSHRVRFSVVSLRFSDFRSLMLRPSLQQVQPQQQPSQSTFRKQRRKYIHKVCRENADIGCLNWACAFLALDSNGAVLFTLLHNV